jgi:hypothetical protein
MRNSRIDTSGIDSTITIVALKVNDIVQNIEKYYTA